METWLRPNKRAVLFGMVLPAIGTLLGLALAFLPTFWPARVAGGVLAALGGLTVGWLLWLLRPPRLAYCDGQLLLWMRPGDPIRMPIEAAEGFLLGQAPSMLPGKRHRTSESQALVLRIAESAHDWQEQEVQPELGKWCGGYVTIRGTWCEPLSVALVNRLNQRLAEVSRARQGAP
jgi:hypothetical protein